MEIKFNPTEEEKGSGATAQISWENPRLMACLDNLFAVREREKIVSVEITREGITVRLEMKNTA